MGNRTMKDVIKIYPRMLGITPVIVIDVFRGDQAVTAIFNGSTLNQLQNQIKVMKGWFK